MLRAIDVNIDCVDVDAQASFWAAALGYEQHGEAAQYRSLLPIDSSTGALPRVILQRVDDPEKAAKNSCTST